MDKVTLSVFADLLINLAAGWFGLVFIVPSIGRGRKLSVLFGNILYCILCLITADFLRRLP